MPQSRLSSAVEATCSTMIGYVVALLSQLAIFPLFGIHIALADNLLIGAFFTVVSIGRSYAVRRIFNRGPQMTKRGSIELARELCVDIAGYTDEDHDWNGYGYGSVDVAEILSAEVVRLRELLTQCAPHVLSAADAEHLLDGFTQQRRPLDDLADQLRLEFVERETGTPLAWQK